MYEERKADLSTVCVFECVRGRWTGGGGGCEGTEWWWVNRRTPVICLGCEFSQLTRRRFCLVPIHVLCGHITSGGCLLFVEYNSLLEIIIMMILI